MPRKINKDKKKLPNPVAKTLAWKRFQKQVVKSSKAYQRVSKNEIQTDEEN